MKLKKYEASTESEALIMIEKELGKDAVVLNVKEVQPKGIFSMFKKPKVEVTAAYEDNPIIEDKTKIKLQEQEKIKQENKDKANQQIKKFEEIKANVKAEIESSKMLKQEQTINELEKKLNDTEALLNKVMTQLSVATYNTSQTNRYHEYENTMLQFFYDKLIEHEVIKPLAEELLNDIENVSDLEKLDINLMVKVVYNRIMKILGEPKVLDSEKTKIARNIIFIGPTGVGKTTTIAKLSSYFIINEGSNVGFITSDTYRIAAVEQLKTYAEILGCDVGVVYENKDIVKEINNMKNVYDFIFIDTAGRSHKKQENLDDLKELLSFINIDEVYLVLSITTKYEDLIETINAYSEIADFKIIFTKLDETNCLGSILNICYETGKEICYVTNGQNVPDDLEVIKPEKIAKALLGSMYE